MQFITGIITGAIIAFIYYSDVAGDLWSSLMVGAGTEIEIAFADQESEPGHETTIINNTVDGISPVVDDVAVQLILDDQPATQAEALMVEPLFAEPSIEPDETITPADNAFQQVWLPFRSEASATGFADKLTSQLERPFFVEKRGPGHYEVGFRYLTEGERTGVLDIIHSITGYRPESS